MRAAGSVLLMALGLSVGWLWQMLVAVMQWMCSCGLLPGRFCAAE